MEYKALLAKKGLIDHNLTLMEDIAVLIEGTSIRSILPRIQYERIKPENCQETDLGDATLMPGLIECHNHLCIDASLQDHLELLSWSSECELTLIALKGLEKDLQSGVTTARCLGDRYYIDTALKKQIDAGRAAGPRLLSAGIGIKGLHGAGHIGSPHCGPEEIRRTCRENLRRGTDLLKLFITPGVPDPDSDFVPSYLSLEEIATAVEEGARANVPVAAHCIGGQGLKNCIDGGVQVIEHMYMASQQDVEWLLASNCVVDLTSGIFLDPSRESFLSPANAEKVKKNRVRVRRNVKRIIDAGIPFVLGTDAYHGFLYREAEYAVELGADTVTALRGITSAAARVCRLEHRTGSLKAGLDADIIAVKGNPLENISCLSQVEMVMKQGRIVV